MRVETLPTGERVIVDPSVTNSRIFLYFYFCVNIGSLTGQISMVYVEKYIGFWLAQVDSVALHSGQIMLILPSDSFFQLSCLWLHQSSSS